MKFLAKLAVVVLILGGILFAAGHAMGGIGLLGVVRRRAASLPRGVQHRLEQLAK